MKIMGEGSFGLGIFNLLQVERQHYSELDYYRNHYVQWGRNFAEGFKTWWENKNWMFTEQLNFLIHRRDAVIGHMKTIDPVTIVIVTIYFANHPPTLPPYKVLISRDKPSLDSI